MKFNRWLHVHKTTTQELQLLFTAKILWDFKVFLSLSKTESEWIHDKKRIFKSGKTERECVFLIGFSKWLHGVQSSTIVLAKIKRLVWFSNLSSFLQIQPNELKFASQFKRNDKQLVKQGKGEKSNNALKCKWRNESYKSMCNNNCLRQNFISVVTCRLVVRIQSAV